jgi:hypothetical protein
MDTTKIIAELDNEIANLTYVRALLAGHNSSRTAPKRRTLSAEARKRIADAQRRRWAKARKLKRPGNT